MKALVTGASGFVGSTLVEELGRRGVETHCLLRSSSSLANLSLATFQRREGDLSDPAALRRAVEGIDVIFHVAGAVAARDRAGYFAANETGTENLLAAAKASPARPRFVYVSSLAAAGPSTPARPHEEGDENLPVSDYGASKLAGEQRVLAERDKLPVVVVRPPSVYGPRDKGIFTFFEAVQKGILPLLGTKRPCPRRYSFVHVDDLVQGIALAGLAGSGRGEFPFGSGEIFYVTGDQEYSWEEAMTLIAGALEKNAFPLRLPLGLMKGAAFACSAYGRAFGKVLPFSLDKMKEIQAPAWTCSNAKAKSTLGFQPYWDLKKGFTHTARWYRENGWL